MQPKCNDICFPIHESLGKKLPGIKMDQQYVKPLQLRTLQLKIHFQANNATI